ncbi:tyrosine-protein kinase BAZ1B [Selaginella moellendorffii]|uniref:tyrosine-protein kinase BAZ1B n=1 Tax=Selaginella moellendorffii TaxID=88036 RepID=UPI000D1CA930|nr:tyrosine-protein kinase BAZ1B [Selaginella moellendorffii]|eukprot:XP_024535584.1 tyrosine-protein kinase BAZ1B [Selaginella moellendorffii]
MPKLSCTVKSLKLKRVELESIEFTGHSVAEFAVFFFGPNFGYPAERPTLTNLGDLSARLRFLMDSVRTRSRGKQQKKREGSWRTAANDETDVEEDDEERSVPVVSGENKRKRAPRSGGRVVKLRTLSRYDGASEVSGSTEDTKVESAEHADATSGKDTDSQVGKRRESSRVRIKTFKVRENAEAKAEAKPGRLKVEKKESKEVTKEKEASSVQKKVDEPKKTPEIPQRPLKVHLTFSDAKRKPAGSAIEPPQAPTQKAAVVKTPSSTPSLSSPVQSPPIDSTPTPQSPPSELRDDEVETSLKIIRKLMKMDSAHPFNRPVDPVGQGVPDYLDIIDTPMDFGTICENLEKRQKYRNASDVYRDIQQIWTNCRKYNHKGDPILDLMKKVQKACSKYWTANGVLRDPKKSKTADNAAEKPSEIFVAKTTSAHIPQKPAAGTSNHKSTCECAVCMNVRRRTARERRAVGLGSARAVKRQIAKMKGKQDLNDLELEELAQLEEVYLDQVEEEDQFYPASYQIPLRAVNPLVLSMGQALFSCNLKKKTYPLANPFENLVSAYAGCKQN